MIRKGPIYNEQNRAYLIFKLIFFISNQQILILFSDDTVDNDIDNYLEEEAIQLPPPIDMWYQCRYCNDTFNSSKKLTIHMNLHEEHDQTDHSCKDCGNVYMNKKVIIFF